MGAFQCARCGGDGPRLQTPPMPGELGTRVFERVCGACWQQWLAQQTALINHYSLNLRDPTARKLLTEQMETFLFDASAPRAD